MRDGNAAHKIKVMDFLYRYERGEVDYHKTSARLQKFRVIRETPGGRWIRHYCGKDKWVSKHSVKRYAYETPEQAMDNFKKRTARAVDILGFQLELAQKFDEAIKKESIVITESSYIP